MHHLRFVHRRLQRRDDADHDRILGKFKERYQEAVHLTLIYPGVKQALDALVQGGHNLGICKYKPTVPCMDVVKHLDLEKYF
ncbi:HAD hydrolase-like protein [Ruegeria sp. HKCCA5426]|uniref:HAD hydrolase-like protein n=1 Tax=Ruegeria sp. HKCCA5426 TaxID=2682985 RepID=UPI00148960CF|nr:HAD hydrolase-like protein [Ruegeria sp. HKCCA5426]